MRSNLFATAAVALYRCGYSVLPILSVNAPFDGRGKAPGVYGSVSQDGTKGPWYLLKEWEKYCIEPAPEAKAAAWGRMADVQGGGLGVACGFGGLVAIDCDRDELIKPIRAILPPILVEKFGRKGFTAFYRSEHSRDDEEWWKKKNYGFEIPDPDDPEKQKRVGLLDFLAAGSQTVLPPSRHKDTGEPYRWLTPATLLNTPLEALPVFTDEHRVEMERVLRDHGWDAPEPAKPRSRATVARPVRVAPASRRDDDVNDAALMNLSAWVPVLGLPRTRPQGVAYRAVAPWRSSSSGRPEARRGTHLSFHPTGIVDFGSGDKFTPVGVVAKARDVSYSEAYAWLRAQ
ncbi:bifunctional DNA primase/polymerase, partial [Nitrobacter sp.]|uniref:bifunctional DNA primase/polymerase n=1 Tax=Nitrobacter sp. TaxID=29420 RepID=UPI00321FF751